MDNIPKGFHDVITRMQILCQEANIPEIYKTVNNSIINHPNHSRIFHVPGYGYYRKDIQQFTKGIMSLFIKKDGRREPSFLNKSCRTCYLYGMRHGSLVHSQIERCCEIINGYIDQQYAIDKMIYIDPCVTRCFELLHDMNMIPIYNELIVFDPFSMYSTAIDLIVYDCNNNCFCAIEIKTVSDF